MLRSLPSERTLVSSYVAIHSNFSSVADPGFAKGGWTMASARSVSLNGGLGAEPPSGVQGQRVGQGAKPPLKLKAFCIFLYKKVAKS